MNAKQRRKQRRERVGYGRAFRQLGPSWSKESAAWKREFFEVMTRIHDDIRAAVLDALTPQKIPFTDAGRAEVEAAVKAALEKVEREGLIEIKGTFIV